jgi:hypothetical protein
MPVCQSIQVPFGKVTGAELVLGEDRRDQQGVAQQNSSSIAARRVSGQA